MCGVKSVCFLIPKSNIRNLFKLAGRASSFAEDRTDADDLGRLWNWWYQQKLCVIQKTVNHSFIYIDLLIKQTRKNCCQTFYNFKEVFFLCNDNFLWWFQWLIIMMSIIIYFGMFFNYVDLIYVPKLVIVSSILFYRVLQEFECIYRSFLMIQTGTKF